jgi:hypothetical protein
VGSSRESISQYKLAFFARFDYGALIERLTTGFFSMRPQDEGREGDPTHRVRLAKRVIAPLVMPSVS